MGNRDKRILSRELVLDALPENLSRVQSFVTELLEQAACPMKTLMQIDVIVEEIFVNIAPPRRSPSRIAACRTIRWPRKTRT